MDPGPELAAGGSDRGYRALVVDDEAPLADVVASYLRREYFEVTVCHTGAQALTVARDVDPDVVVLDLGLPGIDGVEVCRQLRTFSDAYVVMLTARDTEVDTIVGLSVGADDYVTKPFSPRELSSRIRAVLRRIEPASRPDKQVMKIDDRLQIDLQRRDVIVEGERLSLRPTEYRLLYHLVQNAGWVVPHETLLTKVWGHEYINDNHLLRLYITYLRKKIEVDPADPQYIFTERGLGYRFVDFKQDD